ncbi:HAD family phosphatase [Saccharobesus litoralis]|uniref:HAD family phosphatase n=1 Tax=Saccharobesus litoralis TaxID=2172099 RepID=A0A2S0VMN2_9ALTE|nr:HAD family phosphatase [Saccharobesus litoralis]AWB65483.1 HAD family phosphatase [Saccharobesus litoralis]
MVELQQFDAFLFDMDGTIFDSENLYCQVWIETANEFNIPFTKQMYRPFIGIPTKKCIPIAQKMFGKHFAIAPFIQRFTEKLQAEKQKGVPFRDRFNDFFKIIQQLNKPIGLVTSSADEGVRSNFSHCLNGSSFIKQFSPIVSRDKVSQLKPDPESYLIACQKLKLTPQQVLVFEDSNTGLTAALRAGCATIGIRDQIDIHSDVAKQCLTVVNSYDELIEQCKEYNKEQQ